MPSQARSTFTTCTLGRNAPRPRLSYSKVSLKWLGVIVELCLGWMFC